MTSSTFHIGNVAQQVGVSIDTIRYYQKFGVILDPLRTTSGYRLFTPAQVNELRQVRHLQQLGFSLTEIRDLLAAQRAKRPVCAEVHTCIEHKLQQIRERIAALKRLETELKSALFSCERELRHRCSSAQADFCPVLERTGT